jgi:hypothetical protein
MVSAAMFYLPLFALPPLAEGELTRPYYIIQSSFLLILNIAIGAFAFIGVFLFKNRKVQLRACRLCLMLAIVLVGLIFFTSDTIGSGMEQRINFKAGAYLPLIQTV